MDVGPILKDVVEAGQFNRERASQRLFDSGLDAGQAETFLRHWDGLAAAQGLDTDSWVKKHIADIEVGGDDGPGIRFAKKVLYDDTGKIKVEYEDTGTEFNLEDRKVMKAYFDSLEPEKVKQLKFDDPNQYLETVKKIAADLFPEGVTFRQRKGGTEFEHFTSQNKREKYLHSLISTFKNQDIKITVSKADGEKFLYLKRYIDEELGKDIWDTLISYTKYIEGKEEINTKIPTKGGKGKNDWTRWIDQEKKGVEPEASQSANPGGDTGTAPTRQDTSTIIDHVNREGKPLATDIRHTVDGLQSRAKNTLPLKVVDTFAELPEHVKARYRERHMVGGVRGVNDGRSVYIVADAFDSVDQAVAIWMHEQGVHHGLRGLVGDDAKFDSLMDSVFDHFGAENLEDIRQAYRLDFDNVAHRREAAEEMLAHLGEKMARGDELNHMERSMWDQIKTWFAKFLRERGINVALTDEDIAGIVKDAVRWTLDGETKQHSRLKLRKVIAAEFIAQRSKTRYPEFLTPYTAEDMQGWHIRMSDDGVGYALTPDMDLVGVFNNSGVRGRGIEAMLDAISHGAKTLDCIDGRLTKYYRKYGFPIYKKATWDDLLAPKGWNYEKYGRPDVVFLQYPDGLSRNPADVRRRVEIARSGIDTGDTGGPRILYSLDRGTTGRPHTGMDSRESGEASRRVRSDHQHVTPSNGSVEFLPDGRAHVRLFDGADLDQAGEALSRILSERFNEFPPAERLDWRTERPERDLPAPMDDMGPDEAFARDMDEVQVLAEAGK